MAEFKYEQALEKLERIVTELDEADIPLEVRLKRFEEGTKLARQLSQKLEQAKKKVELLVEVREEGPVFESFEEETEGSDE